MSLVSTCAPSLPAFQVCAKGQWLMVFRPWNHNSARQQVGYFAGIYIIFLIEFHSYSFLKPNSGPAMSSTVFLVLDKFAQQLQKY